MSTISPFQFSDPCRRPPGVPGVPRSPPGVPGVLRWERFVEKVGSYPEPAV